MDWSNVSEGIISGTIATLLASIITWLFSKFLSKFFTKNNNTESTTKESKNIIILTPFYISLFISSFLFIITFFSLIYSWVIFNFVYLLTASIILSLVTRWIYQNECPNCHKIFVKNIKQKDTIKEERRPYRYRECTEYLYTDGSVKDRKYTGPEKVVMETWRTEKEIYECRDCKYIWDKLFEVNLDKNNRPRCNIIRTKFKRPDTYDTNFLK